MYLESAFACGMFDGDLGADLRARLAGRDDENFLSGITECLTAWFLTRRLGLAVTPRPAGKECSILEFAIGAPDGDILVEVKAPRRPVARAIAGGPIEDVDIIRRVIRQANRQFKVGRRNLLVIVPKLITFLFPLYEFLRRDIALRALIGESTIRVPIDPGTGGPAGAPTGGFRYSGELSKRKTGGKERRFTRVSGVLFLLEHLQPTEIKHVAMLIHNPFAAQALPGGLWTGIDDEFVGQDGRWSWRKS